MNQRGVERLGRVVNKRKGMMTVPHTVFIAAEKIS